MVISRSLCPCPSLFCVSLSRTRDLPAVRNRFEFKRPARRPRRRRRGPAAPGPGGQRGTDTGHREPGNSLSSLDSIKTLSGGPSASHATLSPDRASVTAFTPYWNQCLEPYAQRISSGEMPCEGLRRRPRAVNSSGRSAAEGVRGRRRPAHRRALTYLLSSTY